MTTQGARPPRQWRRAAPYLLRINQASRKVRKARARMQRLLQAPGGGTVSLPADGVLIGDYLRVVEQIEGRL